MTFERNTRYGLQGTQMTTLVATLNENYLFLLKKKIEPCTLPHVYDSKNTYEARAGLLRVWGQIPLHSVTQFKTKPKQTFENPESCSHVSQLFQNLLMLINNGLVDISFHRPTFFHILVKRNVSVCACGILCFLRFPLSYLEKCVSLCMWNFLLLTFSSVLFSFSHKHKPRVTWEHGAST